MIGTISIKCNAAHPEIALPTIYTHADSPSSIRIIDVPKKIGNWQITSVYVDVIYPDGTNLNKQCVLTGGAWVATIEGNDTVGETKNGYTVLANGTDELGNDVFGYVLGVGGVKVIQSNPSVEPEEQYTLMRLYEQEPTELKDGATYIDDGHLAVYSDGDVVKCANESELPDMDNYYTKSEVDDKLDFFDERFTVVKYTDGTHAAFNVVGELTKSSVTNMDRAVEVRVGTNVTSIGERAFRYPVVHASPLQKVTLPNTITSIGNSAFADTISLSHLEIPDSVTSIGSYAFEFTMAKGLVIPKSVTTIGQRAFASMYLTDAQPLTFAGRTNAQVQAMANYPWGLDSYTQYIKTWNDATKEWVEQGYMTKANPSGTDSLSITKSGTGDNMLSVGTNNQNKTNVDINGKLTITDENDGWIWVNKSENSGIVLGTGDGNSCGFVMRIYTDGTPYFECIPNGSAGSNIYKFPSFPQGDANETFVVKSELDAIIQKLKDDNNLV